MAYICSQCGAVFDTGESCDDRFNTLQIKELEYAEYYAVHHLSVPCYMLQHNLYSRTGWIEAFDLLNRFIHDGLKPEFARKENRYKYSSNNRNWSVTKGENLTEVEQINWRSTIADIRFNTSTVYCRDINTWAQGIIEDAKALRESYSYHIIRAQ